MKQSHQSIRRQLIRDQPHGPQQHHMTSVIHRPEHRNTKQNTGIKKGRGINTNITRSSDNHDLARGSGDQSKAVNVQYMIYACNQSRSAQLVEHGGLLEVHFPLRRAMLRLCEVITLRIKASTQNAVYNLTQNVASVFQQRPEVNIEGQISGCVILSCCRVTPL